MRGGYHTMLASIASGVLKALSLHMAPVRLPEMRVSREVRRYGPASNRTTTLHAPHGLRERERRMRQIARGYLTESNGLVVSSQDRVAP